MGDETERTTTRVEGIKEMIYDAEVRNALVACEAARGGAKSRPLTCLIQKGQQWQAALEFCSRGVVNVITYTKEGAPCRNLAYAFGDSGT